MTMASIKRLEPPAEGDMPVLHPDDAVIDVDDSLGIHIERPGRRAWKISFDIRGIAVLDSDGADLFITMTVVDFYDGYHYCLTRGAAGDYLYVITAEIDGWDDWRSLARSINWLANYD